MLKNNLQKIYRYISAGRYFLTWYDMIMWYNVLSTLTNIYGNVPGGFTNEVIKRVHIKPTWTHTHTERWPAGGITKITSVGMEKPPAVSTAASQDLQFWRDSATWPLFRAVGFDSKTQQHGKNCKRHSSFQWENMENTCEIVDSSSCSLTTWPSKKGD